MLFDESVRRKNFSEIEKKQIEGLLVASLIASAGRDIADHKLMIILNGTQKLGTVSINIAA